MIEPDMKYCPACNDEYMPTIEKCGVCGAKLLNGEDLLALQEQQKNKLNSRKGALTPDDEIVTVFTGPLAEIKRLENLLNKENIGTVIYGDEPSSCGKGCCGGGSMELQIRVQDAQDAMLIIEEDFNRTTAIDSGTTAHAEHVFDPGAEQNTCPACGCEFPSGQTECPDCGLCFG